MTKVELINKYKENLEEAKNEISKLWSDEYAKAHPYYAEERLGYLNGVVETSKAIINDLEK